MPDPTNAGTAGGQEPNAGSATITAGTVAATSATTASSGGSVTYTDGSTFDPQRAAATIAKLREAEKDGKAAAKERDDLAAKLAEIEAAQLTEGERIAKEREEAIAERDQLRAARRQDAVRLAVYGARDEKGLVDADLALAALEHGRITFDADGRPENVGELLDELLEAKPILRGTPAKPKVPDTQGGAGGGKGPDLTADELEAARLTGQDPERFAAMKRLRGDGLTVKVADAIEALRPKG